MKIVTVKELRQYIDDITGDTQKLFVSDEEFLRYLNLSQRYFCEVTGIIKSKGYILTKTGSHSYILPNDNVRPRKVFNPKGDEVEKISFSDIENLAGYNWRDAEGDRLKYWWNDFGSRDDIGFYPKPTSMNDFIKSTSNPNMVGSSGDTATINTIQGVIDSINRNNSTTALLNPFLGRTSNYIDTENKVYVEYSRYPKADIIEIEADEYLKNDILRRIYEKQGAIFDMKKSMMHMQLAEKELKRWKGLSNADFGDSKEKIKPRFF